MHAISIVFTEMCLYFYLLAALPLTPQYFITSVNAIYDGFNGVSCHGPGAPPGSWGEKISAE